MCTRHTRRLFGGSHLKKIYVEAVFSAASVTLCALGLHQAWQYEGETGLLPRAVLLISLILTALWLVKVLWRCVHDSGPTIEFNALSVKRVVVLVLAGAGLMIGFNSLGFYTTTALVVPLTAVGLGYRDIKGLLIGTGLFVLLLVAVFYLLLKVPLPPELLFAGHGG